MSDPSAVERTDLLVRLVLEAVDQRMKDLRDEVARIAVESERRQGDVARLASQLARWLTANTKADAEMSARVEELTAAVDRLNNLAQR